MDGVSRGRKDLALVGVGTDRAGLLLKAGFLAGGRRDLLNVAMTQRRQKASFICISAVALGLGVTLLGTGGRNGDLLDRMSQWRYKIRAVGQITGNAIMQNVPLFVTGGRHGERCDVGVRTFLLTAKKLRQVRSAMGSTAYNKNFFIKNLTKNSFFCII